MQGPTRNLLNQVYQDARMGAAAIELLQPLCLPPEFRKHIDEQLKGYTQIYLDALGRLSDRNLPPARVPMMARMGLWMSTKKNLWHNQSTDHLAGMMIQGNMMGVISMTGVLRQSQGADEDALQLGQRLLEAEQAHIDDMRAFL
ncbi:MAG: hypothetical protein ACOYJA_06740 [Christensenellales bacterium]